MADVVSVQSRERVEVHKYERLRRLTIPIPNPAITEWLMGSECRRIVEEVTSEIFLIYVNTLPVITGNLKRGAYWTVRTDTWSGNGSPRWFGFVGNSALSYRKKTGEPYPRFIEYGKPSRGVAGQYQLRNAAHLVAGGLGMTSGVNIPGIKRDAGGRLHGSRGRFVSNPLNRDR